MDGQHGLAQQGGGMGPRRRRLRWLALPAAVALAIGVAVPAVAGPGSGGGAKVAQPAPVAAAGGGGGGGNRVPPPAPPVAVVPGGGGVPVAVWQPREPIGGPFFQIPTSGACVGVMADRLTPTERIYVALGETAFGDTRAMRIFNPFVFANAWSSGQDAPPPARGQVAQGVVVGGKLFCIGGESTVSTPDGRVVQGVRGTVQRYSPLTDSWDTFAAIPDARAGAAAVAVSGQIYVLGGRKSAAPCTGPALQSVLRFDPKSNTWQPAGTLKAPRSDATAVAVGTNLYLFGGCDVTPQDASTFPIAAGPAIAGVGQPAAATLSGAFTLASPTSLDYVVKVESVVSGKITSISVSTDGGTTFGLPITVPSTGTVWIGNGMSISFVVAGKTPMPGDTYSFTAKGGPAKFLDTVEVYNTLTRTALVMTAPRTSRLVQMPGGPRANPAAVVLDPQHIHVTGGWCKGLTCTNPDGTGVTSSDAEVQVQPSHVVFNPAIASYQVAPTGDLPTHCPDTVAPDGTLVQGGNRAEHALVTSGKVLYAVGGVCRTPDGQRLPLATMDSLLP